ncbi:mitochondrial basic amino acids transporter-like [Uloborus diversus]|uniref:mitochondrial basic amino acids transporter-like n=1 Tax=Uloborus diversus TaxID=327109 RepID=UPI0024095979|nr:mitochondrial basic amino acids transporter-like [Uloborus diversus]XP_054710513.1 mitochondrial basic amino acids transporter-like [Uloborus diversus]
MAVDFFAGCLGGCAGVLVGHPFDTVKVRLQTQDCNNKIYRGTFHCISTIIKQESYQGLYKGMSSPMAGLAAVNAIVFGVYGNIVRSSSSPNSLLNQFMAGSAAGFVQSFVTSPMELAKTRMQLQGQSDPNIRLPYWKKKRVLYKNPLDCLIKTFRNDGLFGFYRGLATTIMRDAPGFGVYFAGYEFLTEKVTDSKGNVNTLSLLCVGGLAGVMSWIVIYPFDVIKSRLQVDGMDGGAKKYKGFLDCVKKSHKTEGLTVFTRGLNSTIIRAFPTNAATFAVFTWVFMICDSSVNAKLDVDEAKSVLMLDKDIQTLTY